MERLTRAVAASRKQLQAIKDRLSREADVPHAYIFDAHLLMLEDPLLQDGAVAVIREDRVNAEWALRTVSEQLHGLFDEFADAYFRERSTDLDDVLGRIQLNLGGAPDAPSLTRLPGSFVLVASDLTPSEAAELDWERVLALVVDSGSATDHTSILARSSGVPAAVGVREATRQIPPGAQVVVDGSRGEVVVEPSESALAAYRAAQEQDRIEDQRLQQTRTLPAVTRDGVAVRLQANVEFPDEAETALLYGAEGIGLFRSEYLLGRAPDWPSEERQVEVYRRLLDRMSPHPVTVRTWDVGADEMAPGGPTSPNPALGERALRLLRRNPGAVPRADPRPAPRGRARSAPDHAPVRGRPFGPRGRPRPRRRVPGRAARAGPRPRGARARGPHPRGPERGRHRRPARGAGGLLQRGDQRPHPVPPGRGPDGPAGGGPLRAAPPGRAARHPGDRPRRGGGRACPCRSAARWRRTRSTPWSCWASACASCP